MILADVLPLDELERLTTLLKTGGPYAGWALFVFLFIWERWRNDRKDKMILRLAMHNERGRSKTIEVLAHVKEVLRTVSDRLGKPETEQPQRSGDAD